MFSRDKIGNATSLANATDNASAQASSDNPPASRIRKTANSMNAAGPNMASQSSRYLAQLRCHATQQDATEDVPQDQLAALQATVEVSGGLIEHFWVTPREYDLILVILLPSDQVSYSSLEMALEAREFVRAVRSTPLYPLNGPADGRHPVWGQALDDDHLVQWEVDGSSEPAGNSRIEPAALVPMNWDEF